MEILTSKVPSMYQTSFVPKHLSCSGEAKTKCLDLRSGAWTSPMRNFSGILSSIRSKSSVWGWLGRRPFLFLVAFCLRLSTYVIENSMKYNYEGKVTFISKTAYDK